MKSVLILGKSSYLGESFKKWLEQRPNEYKVDIVATKNGIWKNSDFSIYDSVVNFAGIAHINNITPDLEDLFYSVNRDLAIEMCAFAKNAGVKQFIQFSSMNVYGDYCECVCDINAVNPSSFYGNSKLQGDIGIHKLEDDNFSVASLRPPFVYGRNCTGNYNSISKIAKKTPIFPDYKNKKSMIYIDNLCEFLRLLIDDGTGGIFLPQNRELVSTADLVREIAKTSNHKVWFTRLFNWAIPLAVKLTRFVRRAFANDYCSLEVSGYFDWKYCVTEFEESIRLTEGK